MLNSQKKNKNVRAVISGNIGKLPAAGVLKD